MNGQPTRQRQMKPTPESLCAANTRHAHHAVAYVRIGSYSGLDLRKSCPALEDVYAEMLTK